MNKIFEYTVASQLNFASTDYVVPQTLLVDFLCCKRGKKKHFVVTFNLSQKPLVDVSFDFCKP
jgi:hypothetical protein